MNLEHPFAHLNLDWWPKYIDKHPDPSPITHAGGKLTREGALLAARALWGDLGTISSTDEYPCLVWCIGQFERTIGRGKTWEIALERSRVRKVKLDAKLKADLARAQEEIK